MVVVVGDIWVCLFHKRISQDSLILVSNMGILVLDFIFISGTGIWYGINPHYSISVSVLVGYSTSVIQIQHVLYNIFQYKILKL